MQAVTARAELSIDDVVRRVQEYAPGADSQLVAEAYLYAALHHRGQVRKNGEDYLVHPLSVAMILAEIRMDVETIAVGLLHDTIEDTQATAAEISQRFGPTVAEMVEGVTKLSKLAYRGKLEEQAENFRKLVLAFGKDIRVIIVKCADRLHNMRTLQFQRPDKQVRIARETLDIYAPLTHRLGLELMKRELEDLSFRYLHPTQYLELEAALELDAEARERYVNDTKALIEETLRSRGPERGAHSEPSHADGERLPPVETIEPGAGQEAHHPGREGVRPAHHPDLVDVHAQGHREVGAERHHHHEVHDVDELDGADQPDDCPLRPHPPTLS